MRARLFLMFGIAIGCSDEPRYQHKQFVSLANSATLPEGAWVELIAPEPLRTTAYHHEACFRPVAPFQLADDPMGIVASDGTPIVIQVEASGPNGNLRLPLSAYQGQSICFGVSDTQLQQEFTHIRLRASSAVEIEHVEWQSTDK
jgi:hypothetical protein